MASLRTLHRTSSLLVPCLMVALGAPPAAFAQEAPLPPLPPSAPPPPPGAPPPPPAAPAAASPMEPLRFVPEDPGLTLMVRTGEVPVARYRRTRYLWYYERGFAAVYSPLCSGICTAELPPGPYHLAVSKDGHRPVPAGSTFVQGPATVRGWYADHSTERILGAVVWVAGLIGGIAMIVASDGHEVDCGGGECVDNPKVDGPLLAGGIGVIVGSAIVGTVLSLQRDKARITIEPLTAAPAPQATGFRDRSASQLAPPAQAQGAAVTVRF